MQNPTNERYVIVTTRAGLRHAFTLEQFQWAAAEWSYWIANAEHVEKLPEGIPSPHPIRDFSVRGLLP